MSPVSDVQVARDLSVLAARQSLPLDILSARDTSSAVAASQNTILPGSWRANLWIRLVRRASGRFKPYYEEAAPTPTMRFLNRAPRAAEPATFQAEWRFCALRQMALHINLDDFLTAAGQEVAIPRLTIEEALDQPRI